MEIKSWQLEEIVENKYKIKSILGQGEQGISYEVEHFDWEMSLRLKVFSPEYWQQHARQIKYTYDHWIALEGCYNISHAFYWDCLQQQQCLISEYIHGVSLLEYHPRIIEVIEALDIAIQIGYGLKDSHAARLIHNNLKPTNIIIGTQHVSLQDFIGFHIDLQSNQENINQENIRKWIVNNQQTDFFQYGKILHYIFYQKKWNPNNNISDQGNWESERGWKLPDELQSIILQCLKEQELNWDIIILKLKRLFEMISKVSYKRSNIIPSRIQVEKNHKQAIAYYESKNLVMAHNLWTLSIENHPCSINALWNNYLCNLREGIASMDLLIRTLEDLTAFEHTQILYAQSELALEMGLHIQDTLERVESSQSNNLELLRVKGEIFYRIRQFDEAISCFESLLSQSKKINNEPQNQTQWFGVPQLYDKDDHYRLAISYYAQKNYEKAREICQEGLTIYPNHSLLHLVDATICYTLGNIEESKQKFLTIQEKYSSSFWNMLHLADWYAGRGIYQNNNNTDNYQARSLYQKALTICPHSIRAIQGFKSSGGSQLSSVNSYCLQFNEWSQIRTLSGHTSIITALAMTSDAHWLVSGDCDGNLFLWDATSGTLTTGLIGHSKHITSLAITNDGKKVASASWDHTIRIWEIPSGACLWEIQGHNESITKISLSQDGRYLISGSWDSTAKIWDLENRSLYATLEHPDVWVKDVALFPNNELAITSTEQDEICIWNIAKAEMLQRIRGLSFCLSNDGQSVMISYYNSLELWEMPSAKLIDYIKINNKELIVAVSRDNSILLTKDENDFISFWDFAYKRKLNILASDEATCCVMNPDNQYMVTTYNTTIYFWENIAQRPFPLFRHTHFLPAMIHDNLKNPDLVENTCRQAELLYEQKEYKNSFILYQSLLKMPGYENSELLFDRMNQCALRQPILRKEVQNITLRSQIPMIGYATSLALACDGRIVLAGNDDDPIRQWNLKNSYVSHRWEGHRRCVSSISMTSDGSMALSGSYDGSVMLWYLDAPDYNEILEIGNTWVNSVAIHPQGKWGIVGTRDGRIIQWDLNTLKSNLLLDTKESNPVVSTLIKENIALISLRDGTMIIWDLAQNKYIAQHRPHGRYITGFDASHTGRLILSSSRLGSILLWESETGKILKEFKHEGEVVKYIRFCYDRFFISLAKDGGLRIWHLDSVEPLSYYYAHDNPITAASISEDGRFLASADEAKILKLWELEWEWKIS